MFPSATSTRFFEPLQGWGLQHCLGQPGPTLDHSFSQEIFPNIQSVGVSREGVLSLCLPWEWELLPALAGSAAPQCPSLCLDWTGRERFGLVCVCTAHGQPCLPAHVGLLGWWSPCAALYGAVVATGAGCPCLELGGVGGFRRCGWFSVHIFCSVSQGGRAER